MWSGRGPSLNWPGLILPVVILLMGPGGAEAAASAASSREIVAAMIEAHGGMDTWKSAPTVSFEDEFMAGSATQGQHSRVVVEQGPRRATIDMVGSDARLSWDGQTAWSENWDPRRPPRFIALLNYYFLNLPWLAADPGVRLGEPGKGTIPGDPVEYITIRMTFDAGAGDTPGDYHVLYIHPETHRLRADAYIVTYRAILPPGVKSTPEHLLIYNEFTTVDGLVVPVRYTIYEGNQLYASCRVRDWSFRKPFDDSRMTMPAGAVVDTTTP